MENNENSYGHVLKYTGIFGGVQGLNILISLVRNKLVAVILGPAGMGLASLYNTIANFLSQATSLGISFGAIRHLSEIFDNPDTARTARFIKTVRVWSIIAALLGMAVCMAAAVPLNDYVFDDENHTAGIMALAPVVAMTALTGGETAILKGARRLGELARIQIFAVAASLVVAVPVYLCFGISGVIPVILLTAAANMIITMRMSYRLFPPDLKGARGLVGEGRGMVGLGLAFVMSGIFGSGAEMVIRSFLNTYANLDTVGLYNAGYVITVTYAGMVLSAMETDYFPRLSAVNHDTAAVNLAANRQMEVSLLIVSPLLAVIIIALPLLIPLLYSGKFAPVIPMVQVAMLSMYAKAGTTPLEYITLAKGHLKAYLVLEFAFNAALALMIIVFYRRWGLTGTGVAMLAVYMANTVMIFAYAAIRYGYRASRQVCLYAAVQFPLGVAVYLSTLIATPWASLATGIAAAIASAAVSVYALHKKTALLEHIMQRMRKKAKK